MVASTTVRDVPARPSIEVRNLRFPVLEAPRTWHGGRRAVSIFFDNLSIFFPAGERFFMTSVKRYQKRIDDPALLRDVIAFCGQEGIHGREHERYNEAVAARGYPAEAMEARVKGLLSFARKTLFPRWQLGVTCALEHLTATLGQELLSDDRILEGAHPAMAALWRWHAAEETEHKSVAFDVFESVGGTYAERASMMIIASVIFWAKVIEQQARMMHADGCLGSPREWGSLFRFLFVHPGGMHRLALAWLDYFRPGFHPSDRDASDLLARWRASAVEA
jgi:uncharacterized protein